MLPHPRTPYDEWVLEQFLENNLPDVVEAGGVAVLRVVCNALNDAVRLSRPSLDDEGPDDYSTIWHAAIDQDRDAGHDLKSTFVGAVRRTAEQLIQRDVARLTEVVEILEAHRWRVFDRIALHVLREAPASALPLIEARVGDREKFRERRLKREYVLLAQSVFPRLRAETQESVLGWIEEGPELEGFIRMRTEMQGTPPSSEERTEYTERWRLEYLRALRDVLPAGWRPRYEALVAKYGEPEAPDFLAIRAHTFTSGPGSPITPTELREMSVPDIVSHLRSWEPPSGEFMGPSPDGLSRALSEVVAENPSRFSEEVEQFKEVEPTYVRGVVSGLRDALGKDQLFSWGPILKLCQWVVDQPVEPGERGNAFERNRGWGWTRKAIADLLEAGFQPGTTQVPFELRQEAWKVLLPLTSDPDPMPSDETGQDRSEPDVVAINTTRGEAMYAVVRYALWVKENLDKALESPERKASLDEMPEVREVLQAHLDTGRDPSLAIRSVYGRWLPWLIYIDAQWVKANLGRIFPPDEASTRFRDVAWDTYVIYSQVYNNVADVLLEEYGRAAGRVDRMGTGRRRPADPADHLAEHLMALYWMGKIEREGPELTQFYAHASDDVCGHAMWFVGRAFAKGEEEPPPDIVDRMKALFEWRVGALVSNPQRHHKELEQFGSWFASGRFGEDWSLARLQDILTLGGSAEPDSLVMDQLVKWAPVRPNEVLECVRMMVEGAHEDWKILGWQDEIRQVVSIGLQSGEPARSAATVLVNILGAKGHLEFRDLLGS